MLRSSHGGGCLLLRFEYSLVSPGELFGKVAFRICDFSEKAQGLYIVRSDYVGPRRRVFS